MFILRFVLLFLTWCGFSGMYDPFHLGLGVMSSLWVAGVSTHLTLSYPFRDRPHGPLRLTVGLLGYLVWLMKEIVLANLQVLRLSLTPRVKTVLTPRVVEFRSRLADDFSRYLLAHSITLTPGTVTVRVDGDRFLVHALTETMAAGLPGEMEERLLRLYGGRVEADVA